MARILRGDADELHALAGKVPGDIASMFSASLGARLFFRRAHEQRLSEEEWVELLAQMARNSLPP